MKFESHESLSFEIEEGGTELEKLAVVFIIARKRYGGAIYDFSKSNFYSEFSNIMSKPNLRNDKEAMKLLLDEMRSSIEIKEVVNSYKDLIEIISKMNYMATEMLSDKTLEIFLSTIIKIAFDKHINGEGATGIGVHEIGSENFKVNAILCEEMINNLIHITDHIDGTLH